ncbi:MAG: DNA topoisomerase IV subunit A [Proteobacteria bacterium]|nr:DNA topoisomerase IV subunit A [Pseudomonadota bacterium]
MKKKINEPAPVSIETVSLCETAKQRYLNYALSVITSRALPDVRDGMKPVQRRILYGMHEMHLTHEVKFQKSAQVVGQVMGRYHPHGDSAIYDALVRLSQPFTMRYPFVDGQGNFGSMDGDSAAAYRYTEARLQPIADAMLEDLNEHVVDFQPNYSGTLREPTVLPTAIPALLVNGSKGIAVGMATDIPPHNLSETIDGCIAMIDDPDVSLDALCKLIPGPDFPTGGRILTSHEDIKKVYETGRGPIEIQSDYHVEQEGKKTRIIITNIPYQVNKRDLCKAIADLIESNKLPLLTNVQDESTTDVRIVLDLKNGADPNTVMAYLFKHTDLQARFNVNMTCIVPGDKREDGHVVYQPRRLGLRDIIRYFIDFRLEVVTRRMQYQLSQLEARIHILEGYIKLFDGLDEAIHIIREAEDKDDASRKLCARFHIDDEQAEAILQLRLYRLAKLEIDKIEAELAAKTKEADHIRNILSSDKRRWKVVREELVYAKKTYGDERRTQFDGKDLSDSYSAEKYIIDEDCYVIVTRSGLFKRQRSFSDVSSTRTKENDAVAFVRYGSTRAPLILLSSLGKAYTLLVDQVPATTGHGSPVATVFKLEDGEQIIGAYIDDPRFLCPDEPKKESKTLLDLMEPAQNDAQSGRYIVAVSRQAQVVRISLDAFSSVSSATGRYYMRLNAGDTVIRTAVTREAGYVSLISDNTRANVFPILDVPVLKMAGKGYRAIGLDPGTSVAAARIVQNPDEGVRIELSDHREITISERRLAGGERGGKGRLLMRRGSVLQVIEDSKYDIDDPNATPPATPDPSTPES